MQAVVDRSCPAMDEMRTSSTSTKPLNCLKCHRHTVPWWYICIWFRFCHHRNTNSGRSLWNVVSIPPRDGEPWPWGLNEAGKGKLMASRILFTCHLVVIESLKKTRYSAPSLAAAHPGSDFCVFSLCMFLILSPKSLHLFCFLLLICKAYLKPYPSKNVLFSRLHHPHPLKLNHGWVTFCINCI